MPIPHVGKLNFSALFKARTVRLGFLAFLLALAAAGHTWIHGNAQSPSSSQASTSAKPSEAAHQAKPTPTASDPDQQISQLLQLATDLKAEVDKTNQEQLSISVVRKAAAIEQLAHKLRIGVYTR